MLSRSFCTCLRCGSHGREGMGRGRRDKSPREVGRAHGWACREGRGRETPRRSSSMELRSKNAFFVHSSTTKTSVRHQSVAIPWAAVSPHGETYNPKRRFGYQQHSTIAPALLQEPADRPHLQHRRGSSLLLLPRPLLLLLLPLPAGRGASRAYRS